MQTAWQSLCCKDLFWKAQGYIKVSSDCFLLPIIFMYFLLQVYTVQYKVDMYL